MEVGANIVQPIDLAPIVIRLSESVSKQADAIREMQQTIAAQADQIVSLSKG